MFKNFISLILVLIFTVISVVPVEAQNIFQPQSVFSPSGTTPYPGSSSLDLSELYQPPVLSGIKIFPKEPFRFDFLMTEGDSALSFPRRRESMNHNDRYDQNMDPRLHGDDNMEAMKLIKYFLASLTVPEGDLWVNLSPHEPDRIISDALGETQMGHDLLAQDYMLKKLTASLMHPEGETGKKFWEKIYSAVERSRNADSQRNTSTELSTGTSTSLSDQIPEMFNKIWIVPDTVEVYQNNDVAYITNAKLKVMTESEYVSMREAESVKSEAKDLQSEEYDNASRDTLHEFQSKKIIQDIIIPIIEHEVNHGESFAPLRQIFHSMILAKWYESHFKNSIIGQKYVDQNKISGLSFPRRRESTGHNGRYDQNIDPRLHGDDNSRQTINQIYQSYLDLFKTGVTDVIREEYDPIEQKLVTRKYFSGGFEGDLAALDKNQSSQIDLNEFDLASLKNFSIELSPPTDQKFDSAMIFSDEKIFQYFNSKQISFPQLVYPTEDEVARKAKTIPLEFPKLSQAQMSEYDQKVLDSFRAYFEIEREKTSEKSLETAYQALEDLKFLLLPLMTYSFSNETDEHNFFKIMQLDFNSYQTPETEAFYKSLGNMIRDFWKEKGYGAFINISEHLALLYSGYTPDIGSFLKAVQKVNILTRGNDWEFMDSLAVQGLNAYFHLQLFSAHAEKDESARIRLYDNEILIELIREYMVLILRNKESDRWKELFVLRGKSSSVTRGDIHLFSLFRMLAPMIHNYFYSYQVSESEGVFDEFEYMKKTFQNGQTMMAVFLYQIFHNLKDENGIEISKQQIDELMFEMFRVVLEEKYDTEFLDAPFKQVFVMKDMTNVIQLQMEQLIEEEKDFFDYFESHSILLSVFLKNAPNKWKGQIEDRGFKYRIKSFLGLSEYMLFSHGFLQKWFQDTSEYLRSFEEYGIYNEGLQTGLLHLSDADVSEGYRAQWTKSLRNVSLRMTQWYKSTPDGFVFVNDRLPFILKHFIWLYIDEFKNENLHFNKASEEEKYLVFKKVLDEYYAFEYMFPKTKVKLTFLSLYFKDFFVRLFPFNDFASLVELALNYHFAMIKDQSKEKDQAELNQGVEYLKPINKKIKGFSSEALPIDIDIYPNKFSKRVVISFHGLAGNKDSSLGFLLQTVNFPQFSLVSFSSSRITEMKEYSMESIENMYGQKTYDQEVEDCRKVVKYILNNSEALFGFSKEEMELVFVGTSFGGLGALTLSPEFEQLSKVIVINTGFEFSGSVTKDFPDFPLKQNFPPTNYLKNAASNFKGDVVIVHGKEDSVATPKDVWGLRLLFPDSYGIDFDGLSHSISLTSSRNITEVLANLRTYLKIYIEGNPYQNASANFLWTEHRVVAQRFDFFVKALNGIGYSQTAQLISDLINKGNLIQSFEFDHLMVLSLDDEVFISMPENTGGYLEKIEQFKNLMAELSGEDVLPELWDSNVEQKFNQWVLDNQDQYLDGLIRSKNVQGIAFFGGLNDYKSFEAIGRSLYDLNIPDVQSVYREAADYFFPTSKDAIGQFLEKIKSARLKDDFFMFKNVMVLHQVAYFRYLQYLVNQKDISLDIEYISSESLGGNAVAIISGVVGIQGYLKIAEEIANIQKKYENQFRVVKLKLPDVSNFLEFELSLGSEFKTLSIFKYISATEISVQLSNDELSLFEKFLTDYPEIEILKIKKLPFLSHHSLLLNQRKELEEKSLVYRSDIQPLFKVISGGLVIQRKEDIFSLMFDVLDQPLNTLKSFSPSLYGKNFNGAVIVMGDQVNSFLRFMEGMANPFSIKTFHDELDLIPILESANLVSLKVSPSANDIPIVDENGDFISWVDAKQRYHLFAGQYIHGSNLMLFRLNGSGEKEYLLQKRAEGNSYFPGAYDVSVAGGRDYGESIFQTTLREFNEETKSVFEVREEEIQLLVEQNIVDPIQGVGFKQARRSMYRYELTAEEVMLIDINLIKGWEKTREVDQWEWVSESQLKKLILHDRGEKNKSRLTTNSLQAYYSFAIDAGHQNPFENVVREEKFDFFRSSRNDFKDRASLSNVGGIDLNNLDIQSDGAMMGVGLDPRVKPEDDNFDPAMLRMNIPFLMPKILSISSFEDQAELADFLNLPDPDDQQQAGVLLDPDVRYIREI